MESKEPGVFVCGSGVFCMRLSCRRGKPIFSASLKLEVLNGAPTALKWGKPNVNTKGKTTVTIEKQETRHDAVKEIYTIFFPSMQNCKICSGFSFISALVFRDFFETLISMLIHLASSGWCCWQLARVKDVKRKPAAWVFFLNINLVAFWSCFTSQKARIRSIYLGACIHPIVGK